MTKLCSAFFKYENNLKIGWEKYRTVLKCTHMRARVEKVDVLGWNKSNTCRNIGGTTSVGLWFRSLLRRIVYMDDIYIHKNWCLHEVFLNDQNYEQDVTTISHHKGQRYGFIAAILDADQSVPAFERTDTQK